MSGPITKGSFDVASQKRLSDLMIKKPEEFNINRYNNALKYLGEISPAMVDMWLARPVPDGQISRQAGAGDFTNPKGTVVVECRVDSTNITKESPYQITNRVYCGGKLSESNAAVYTMALKQFNEFGFLNQPPARVVFYDNFGKGRGPEMALRYIDTLLNNSDAKVKALINKQDIYFLNGGVAQYKKDIPQSKFLTDWPKSSSTPSNGNAAKNGNGMNNGTVASNGTKNGTGPNNNSVVDNDTLASNS